MVEEIASQFLGPLPDASPGPPDVPGFDLALDLDDEEVFSRLQPGQAVWVMGGWKAWLYPVAFAGTVGALLIWARYRFVALSLTSYLLLLGTCIVAVAAFSSKYARRRYVAADGTGVALKLGRRPRTVVAREQVFAVRCVSSRRERRQGFGVALDLGAEEPVVVMRSASQWESYLAACYLATAMRLPQPESPDPKFPAVDVAAATK